MKYSFICKHFSVLWHSLLLLFIYGYYVCLCFFVDLFYVWHFSLWRLFVSHSFNLFYFFFCFASRFLLASVSQAESQILESTLSVWFYVSTSHDTHTLTHTYTRRSRTLSWCWEVQSFGTNGAVTAANIHGDTNRSELLFPWRRTDADGVKPFPALYFSSWFSRFYTITPRVTPPVRQVSPTSQKTPNGNKRKTGGEIKQQTTEKQKWIWTTADGKSNNVSV